MSLASLHHAGVFMTTLMSWCLRLICVVSAAMVVGRACPTAELLSRAQSWYSSTSTCTFSSEQSTRYETPKLLRSHFGAQSKGRLEEGEPKSCSRAADASTDRAFVLNVRHWRTCYCTPRCSRLLTFFAAVRSPLRARGHNTTTVLYCRRLPRLLNPVCRKVLRTNTIGVSREWQSTGYKPVLPTSRLRFFA